MGEISGRAPADRDELVATARAVHDLEVSAPEAEPTREQVDEGTVGRSVDRGRRQPGAQISSAVTGQDVRTRARHDDRDLQDDPGVTASGKRSAAASAPGNSAGT